jgi:hypothetical protein
MIQHETVNEVGKLIDVLKIILELVIVPLVWNFTRMLFAMRDSLRDLAHTINGINGQPGMVKQLNDMNSTLDILYEEHLRKQPRITRDTPR